MYIDFHIHAYADEIAARAVQKLKDTAQVDAFTDGTIADTRKKLEQWGIAKGVLLPVATKPTQQTTINTWAIENNHGNIISFGTVHPYSDSVEQELERIAAAGIKGIKLHPDYQDCYMFDTRMQAIYKKCDELGLMVVLHMGYDPVSPKTHHAMPYDLAEMAEKYPSVTFIGAHMGGMNNWESVLRYLTGAPNVYIDTAFIAPFMSDEMLLRMVSEYGEEKILLASDLPWSRPTDEIAMIERVIKSEAAKEKIFYKNAAALLGLD